MHYFGVPKLQIWFRNENILSTPFDPKWLQWLGAFHKPWAHKRCETCVPSLNALFRGTEVANMVSQRKHPIYSIRPKMKFCSGRDHFTNHQHVKRCETCVSGLNALIRGTEVANMVSQRKHPCYSIRPKMMYGSGWEHFTNLGHTKDAKLVFRAWMHYFGVPKLRIWFRNENIQSTPLDPKWSFAVVGTISQTIST